MRAYIRNHLEMDDDELPDVLLNLYLQDGYDATLALTNRWPRQEEVWSASKVVDSHQITLPLDCNPNAIMSVITGTGYRLAYLNHENAEDLFAPTAMIGVGAPIYWSFWDGLLYMWPEAEPTVAFDVTIRGYRQPVWTDNAATVPDIDARLHQAICYYAMSLSYAAQEDEILEGVYLARWQRDCNARIKMIMEPAHHRPLVLHGGTPIGGVSPFIVNLPDGP